MSTRTSVTCRVSGFASDQDEGRAARRRDQGTRPYIAAAIREAVHHRDLGRCRHCNTDSDLHYGHVVPYSRGGRDEVENLQILCGRCNRLKGASL